MRLVTGLLKPQLPLSSEILTPWTLDPTFYTIHQPPFAAVRLIDSCITQLKAQGPSRTCSESKEEGEKGSGNAVPLPARTTTTPVANQVYGEP